jgi:hypothetical protein
VDQFLRQQFNPHLSPQGKIHCDVAGKNSNAEYLLEYEISLCIRSFPINPWISVAFDFGPVNPLPLCTLNEDKRCLIAKLPAWQTQSILLSDRPRKGVQPIKAAPSRTYPEPI